MWISILNYNSGQIEVYDVTDCFAENETAADDNINVEVKRNYYAKDDEPTHNVNCSITIK